MSIFSTFLRGSGGFEQFFDFLESIESHLQICIHNEVKILKSELKNHMNDDKNIYEYCF